VDILLENEETVIAVEVKAKPVLKDIDHHIKQLKIVKEKWISIKKGNKKFLGGIAGAIWDKDLKKDVQNAGLFVIEQSGDTFMIDMPEGWKPVEF
jgi:Holliday junction resolvase-like predicted endonuclease